MKIFVIKLSNTVKIILSLVIVGLVCFGGYQLVWQGMVKPAFAPKSPIFQGSPESKKIAFTCNVAWGNEELPKMLDIFEKNNIRITFFLEGRWAENYPELAKQLAEKHEIGNHGYGHKHHNALSLEGNLEEIKKGQEAIEKVTGIKTVLFAPPYGEWSEKVVQAAGELNHLTIMWSIDTIDWQRPAPTTIHQRVVEKAHNGAIILMHPVEQTVAALPGIIKELKAAGYEIVPVSELLK